MARSGHLREGSLMWKPLEHEALSCRSLSWSSESLCRRGHMHILCNWAWRNICVTHPPFGCSCCAEYKHFIKSCFHSSFLPWLVFFFQFPLFCFFCTTQWACSGKLSPLSSLRGTRSGLWPSREHLTHCLYRFLLPCANSPFLAVFAPLRHLQTGWGWLTS